MTTRTKAPPKSGAARPKIPRLVDDPEFAGACEKVRALNERARLQREKIDGLHRKLADSVNPEADAQALLDDPAGAVRVSAHARPAELTEAHAELDVITRAVKSAEELKAMANQKASHRLVGVEIKEHNATLGRRVALAFVELEAAMGEHRRFRSDLSAAGLTVSHLPAALRPAWLNLNGQQIHNKATGFLHDMVEDGFLTAEEATTHITNAQSLSRIRSAARKPQGGAR